MGWCDQSQSYFKVTHADLNKARVKLLSIEKETAAIDNRLRESKVVITSWFGLKRKVMTQREHVVKSMHCWAWFHDMAEHLGYISPEEHDLLELRYRLPDVEDLDLWISSEQIFLTESDWRKVNICLKWRENE